MSHAKKYRMHEKADDRGSTRGRVSDRRRRKQAASRLERRRAKDEPNCVAGYGLFQGYEL